MSGAVLWALLPADGEVESGIVAVDPVGADFLQLHPSTTALFDDKVGPALERLRRAMGEGLAAHEWRAVVPRDLLVGDEADAEPEVAWDVGRRLIPPPLLAELQRRLDRPELGPLPLVVAPSPGLAHLPYGLLAITPPGDAPPLGRRLVEAAVVTLAPPSALAAELRARPAASPPFDVRLAVVDPVGDLPGTAGLADRAGLDPAPAGRAAVVEALRGNPAGDPGVLVWAGRAVAAGGGGNPLEAGLRLRGRRADGTDERLTTGEVVFDRLPAPRRVVLLGCSTLGAARDHEPDRPKHLADAEEWWGFPVVLLNAGASAVLATTWKTIDCPATAAIAAELVDAARNAPDLAAALRDVQLRCLAEWAQQRQGDRSFTFTAADRHPHLWAAWAVTGAQRG
jgi:hypothetical protein